jgi:hypothetical protein
MRLEIRLDLTPTLLQERELNGAALTKVTA